MDASAWRTHFRHETFRGGQEEALVKMEEALKNERKFIIAELPTGVGKSDIAMALGRSVPSSYVVTSQNILIEQYKKDFGKLPLTEFYSVKGKRHYSCNNGAENCNEGDKKGCRFWKKHAPDNQVCNYKTERDTTAAAKIAMLNTTYYSVATGGEIWGKRNIAIIDEGHNLAKEVMSLTELNIDDYKLKRLRLHHTVPDFGIEDEAYPKSVSNAQFKGFIMVLKSELDSIMEMIAEGHDAVDFWDSKDIELLKDLHSRVVWYVKSVADGVEWVVDRELTKKAPYKIKAVIARPLETAYFAPKMLFQQADHFILQSATIVDPKKYCAELGIPMGKGEVQWIKEPSPFPKENRPVYKMNTATMSHKVIDRNLSKVAEMVEEILDARPNEKGLIHTNSYKIQKYLEDHFIMNDRLMFPKPSEREDAIDEHIHMDKPSVLVSPSITEGFDGKYDICRFQIICKIPYPSLGDRRVKILANRDWSWYDYMTLKTIIQAVGRGCRAEDDWCHTYILDDGIDKFLNRVSPSEDIMEIFQDRAAGLATL